MSQLRERKGYELRDSPLFRVRTRKKLAEILQSSIGEIDDLLSRESLYVRKWKHKTEKDKWILSEPSSSEASSYRPIDIPDKRLKRIQSRIADLLARVSVPDWLFSPVKGRSYVDNAARHKSSRAFWLLDIADYFPSCSDNNVAHFFRAKMDCSPDVVAILVSLTTWKRALPQGSPCSPALAYYSNLDMWQLIAQSVTNADLTHSVYADDITISGPQVKKSVIWDIKKLIHKHGHKIKAAKELSLIDSPADITGVIVADGRTKLPNRQLKRLFELRGERHRARSAREQMLLDQKIAGREAQRKQVEQR